MKRQHQLVPAIVCAFVVVATCAQAAAGATGSSAQKASAASAAQPMAGVAGPYSSVATSPNLNCSVLGPSATSEIFNDTACGTYVAVNGVLYGPSVVPAGFAPGGYTPVSQTTQGAGTAADPQVTTTTVAVGATGLSITQTDTWNGGGELQTTDTVSNASGGAQSVQLYRALDCYAGGDDTGYGQLSASWLPPGAVGCQDLDQLGGPGGQVLTWIPTTPGSTAVEDGYAAVWNDVAAHAAFPNTCQCGSAIDNAMGLSWGLDVVPGSPVDVSSRLDLVPSQLVLTTETLTDPVYQVTKNNVGTGEADWTITATNAGPTPMLAPSIAIDQPSAGSIDLAATATRGSSCSAAESSGYVCMLGDLAPGDSVDLRIVVDTTGSSPPANGDPLPIYLSAYPLNEGAAVPLTGSFSVFAPQLGIVAGYTLEGKTLQLKSISNPLLGQTYLAAGIGVTPPKYVFATSFALGAAPATALVAGTGYSGVLQATDPSSDSNVCGGFACIGALANISPITTVTDAKHPAVIKLTWGAALGSLSGTDLYLREPSDPPGSPGRKLLPCVKVKGFLVPPPDHPGTPATPCLAKPLTINAKGVGTDMIDVLAGDPTFGRR